MKNSLPFLRLLLPALAASLLLWSCQNDAKTDEHPGDKHGNTLNIRIEASATALNPYLTVSAYSRYVSGQIFQTLGVIHPESLNLEPLIIKAIPAARQIADGPYQGALAYDFEIIPEAVWDNGSPVTGHDLVFTFKVQLNPGLPLYNFGGYIEDLQAIEVDSANPKKFTVYFKKYYILGLETICQTAILPAYHYDPQNLLGNIPLADLLDAQKAKALAKENAAFQQFTADLQQAKYINDPASIAGSGPYLPLIISAEQTVLVKKPNWWGDALTGAIPQLGAYPDTIIYRFIRDEAAIENMLRTGDLDVVLTMSPENFLRLQKDSFLSRYYDFEIRWQAQYNRWIFDMRDPILADKRVRQALAHIVDYDYLLNTIQQGISERTVGPIHPAKPYYAKNIVPYDFNIQKAKDLLAEAGWTDSNGDGIADKMLNGKLTPLTLEVLATTNNPVTEQLVASLEQTARNAGIRLTIVPIDLTALTLKTKNERYQTATTAIGQHPGLNDLYQNFHSKSVAPAGDNRSRIALPQLDSLITAIRGTSNEAERNKYYLQAQQILHDEVPEVYLYAPKQRYIGSKRFEHVFSSNRPGFYENLFKWKGNPKFQISN